MKRFPVLNGVMIDQTGSGFEGVIGTLPPSLWRELYTRMNWLLRDSSLKGTYSYVYTSQKRVLYKKN